MNENPTSGPWTLELLKSEPAAMHPEEILAQIEDFLAKCERQKQEREQRLHARKEQGQ
jgi:hypothetical protein